MNYEEHLQHAINLVSNHYKPKEIDNMTASQIMWRYSQLLEKGISYKPEEAVQKSVLKYLTPKSVSCMEYYPSILNVVYFFYNTDNDLLYIGRTNNFCTRWKDHCNSNKTMCEVTSVNVHVFDTKQEVYFYEIQKIAELNPLWNKSILSTTVSVYNILPRDVHSFVCKIPEK